MSEIASKLLTRENITLVLSTFGSIGTLITIITTFVVNRKNLKIRITETFYLTDPQRLYIKFLFENRSRLPISITSILLSFNTQKIKPTKRTYCIHDYKNSEGKEIVDRIFTYNSQLPITVAALDATRGYMLFDIPQEALRTLTTPLTCLIYSTRPPVQQIELSYKDIQYTKTLHDQ